MDNQNNQTHGQLIKNLRKERSITQVQLTKNISHRTTLISFEKHGTQIDYPMLLKYLNRMNITVEEYQYLYDRKYPTPKDAVKADFWKLVVNQKLTLVSPDVKKQLQLLLHAYNATNDFFYYSLYAQLFLIISYRNRDFDLTDPTTLAIKLHVEKYLVKIQNWGRFELVLFSNCLFLFDDEFIQACLVSSLKQTQFYSGSNYYTADLKALITHGLILSLERHNLSMFNTLFRELTKLQSHSPDTELVIYTRIFDLIHATTLRGINQSEKETLFSTLKWLKMDEWIEYINTIIESNFAK